MQRYQFNAYYVVGIFFLTIFASFYIYTVKSIAPFCVSHHFSVVWVFKSISLELISVHDMMCVWVLFCFQFANQSHVSRDLFGGHFIQLIHLPALELFKHCCENCGLSVCFHIRMFDLISFLSSVFSSIFLPFFCSSRWTLELSCHCPYLLPWWGEVGVGWPHWPWSLRPPEYLCVSQASLIGQVIRARGLWSVGAEPRNKLQSWVLSQKRKSKTSPGEGAAIKGLGRW